MKNVSEPSFTEPKGWLPTSEFTALYGRNPVAGSATPTSYAGHSTTGVYRNPKLTYQLDRLMGSGQIDIAQKHYNQALMVESTRRNTALIETMITKPDTAAA